MHLPRLLRHPALLLVVVGVLISSGCASTPEVGVRPSFSNTTVRTVAVAPLYATSRFSQAPEEHARVIALYQEITERWLAEQGFDVVPSEAFVAYLDANEALQLFEDGMVLRGPLNRYFEPDEGRPPSLEVETLRGLHAAGKLPADVIFLGEVVYQTDGTCRVAAGEFDDYARVVGAEGGSAKARPAAEFGCVVSHFQAKLVDASTGETMWHNRFLRELRDPPITDAKRIANITSTVATTLGGDHGMRRFLAVDGLVGQAAGVQADEDEVAAGQ